MQLGRAYDSGEYGCDVLHDFYIPALGLSVSYDRMTGFFSSGALAVAARGVAGLVRNGGSMRIVASPYVPESDFEALRACIGDESQCETLDAILSSSLDLDTLANEIERNHVRALAWMLAAERLDLRIVIPGEVGKGGGGIFHQKVGLLRDSAGNTLSFSGSINETAAGWTENIEEFKVFRGWEPGELEYVNHDTLSFARYWNAAGSRYQAVPLPRATLERFAALAPDDIEDLDLEIPRRSGGRARERVRLRPYQSEAVRSWFDAGCRGIFEMATGTGKTKTAVACLEELSRQEGSQLTVVTAPYQHIAVQWAHELKSFEPISTFGASPWEDAFSNAFADMKLGLRRHLVVIAVQNTAAGDRFLRAVGSAALRMDRVLLIADEVHGLGAPQMRRALGEFYDHRLGLSATPQRWFDEEGSEVLASYFGPEPVYVFGIHEALHWVDPATGQTPLCPYVYFPVFVSLDDDELQQYAALTDRIVREMQMNDDLETNQRLEHLLFRRAGIVKMARGKYAALSRILDDIGALEHCLVYCHQTDQMNGAAEEMRRRRIRYHRFTGAEGTSPTPDFGGLSEREWILRDLEEGNTQALVAMKCLDEGVDVPMARLGIILASSSNPREFIQRRGRLLRRSPGKERAVIYDVVVAPSPASLLDPVARDMERRVFSKELARIDEFARDADNQLEARTAIMELMATL